MRAPILLFSTMMIFTGAFSAKAELVPEEKARVFLAKREPCVFASGLVNEGGVGEAVVCAWDGVAHEGTVNESSGCFVGTYNLNTGKYFPFFKNGSADGGVTGPCIKEKVIEAFNVSKGTYANAGDWNNAEHPFFKPRPERISEINSENAMPFRKWLRQFQKVNFRSAQSITLYDKFGVEGQLEISVPNAENFNGGQDNEVITLRNAPAPVKSFANTIYDAIEKGDLKKVQDFVSKNPAIIAQKGGSVGFTPLMTAINSKQYEIFRYLLAKESKTTLSRHERDGYTPLLLATDINNSNESEVLESIKALIESGASLNDRMSGEKDLGPVALAAKKGRNTVVEYLISKGASPNETDSRGKTPVFQAAANAKVDTLKLLIRHGAELKRKSKNGENALHTAALFIDDDQTIDFLIKNGIDVDARTSDGTTALMYAAWKKSAKTVESLILHGASIAFKDSDGASAIDLAEQNLGDETPDQTARRRQTKEVIQRLCVSRNMGCRNPLWYVRGR